MGNGLSPQLALPIGRVQKFPIFFVSQLWNRCASWILFHLNPPIACDKGVQSAMCAAGPEKPRGAYSECSYMK